MMKSFGKVRVGLGALAMCLLVAGWAIRGFGTTAGAADMRPAGDTQADARVARTSAESAAPPPGAVAVLDVTAVMNEMPELREMRTSIQADFQRAQAQFQKRQQELVQRRQELQEKSADDPAVRGEMEKLGRELEQFQAEIQLQQRELLAREGKALMEAYARLNAAVSEYCKEQGIALVLRSTGRPANVANAQEVLAYVNRDVIWAQDGLDITPAIKGMLIGKDSRP
ncbi:MAG: OmpH family outer membrane protein [Thermogutta sp.]|nr:OmpH family outer membrane protein [Thermogutta sp.]